MLECVLGCKGRSAYSIRSEAVVHKGLGVSGIWDLCC